MLISKKPLPERPSGGTADVPGEGRADVPGGGTISFFWTIVARSILLLAVLALSGCERCSSEAPIATLSSRSGKVDRDLAKAIDKWLSAEVGSTFDVGDGVRTGSKSGAELTLDDGSVLALEEDTLIRFLDRPPGSEEQALDLQVGAASLEAPEDGAILRTLFGQATLAAGTKVELSRSDAGLEFRIQVGKATLENDQGEKTEVGAGEVILVSVGGAIMEPVKEKAPEPEPTPEPETPGGPIQANVRGAAVKLKGPGGEAFTPLAAGETTLEVGSTVQVGSGSAVTLSRGTDKAELAAGGTYVVGGGGQFVQAESGKLEVTSEGKVAIVVPGGTIVTSGGSATITALGKEGTRVEAKAGTVTLRGKNEETLVAGETGKLSPAGEASVVGRGLAYADVETVVGENLVIHDPAPPTAVRFVFGGQCEDGTVRLQGSKASVPADDFARGKGSVSLLLGRGTTDYTLSCTGADGKPGPVKVRGKITVLQDAGSRTVPKSAPFTAVEVNGRSYTVLYQNLLPQVALRWSKGPAGASSFKLHVSGPGGGRTISTSSPSYTFGSGVLGEGTHRVYFEGGGMVSRQTAITILFDNATPTASLSTPTHLSADPGGEVTLAGTALPGWEVEVDGKPVGQDAGSRFSVKAKVPESGRPVSVRLTHPTRGTHIYLRRGAGGK